MRYANLLEETIGGVEMPNLVETQCIASLRHHDCGLFSHKNQIPATQKISGGENTVLSFRA